MLYNSFTHFVDQINKDLGPFCNKFQYKRILLNGKERVAERNALFGLPDKDRNWAINKGGGIELQYQITVSYSQETVGYGLGFNTQYVQFASNSVDMVKVMKPYMQAFLGLQTDLEADFPDYTIINGDYSELINPQYNKYVMWGKRLLIKRLDTERFEVDDDIYQEVLSDLQKQFSAYVKIFSRRNEIITMRETIKEFKEVLEHKYQIILQGPPGTGKTYTAKDIAEEIIFGTVTPDKDEQKERLELSEQFKLIQFHPAYTYEDLVRGIRVDANGSNVHYKTENRVLGEFAEKANKNYINSQKTVEALSKEKWLDEEFINFIEEVDKTIRDNRDFKLNDKVSIVSVDADGEGFIYGGEGWEVRNHRRMKFTDVKLEILAGVQSRNDIQSLENASGRAKQHATYDLLVVEKFNEYLQANNRPAYTPNNSIVETEKKYILVIDEINRANLPAVLGELIYALEYRGQRVKSMYKLDHGDNSLVLPKNLLIIGTMNTADRSVGHIDYAIRRRFAFKDIPPSSDVIKSVVSDTNHLKDKALKLYANVAALFTEGNIATDFKGKDVQLGHSYFLADSENKLKMKLDYEIKPLLNEYLKDGILLDKTTISRTDGSGTYTTEEYIEYLKVQ